MKPQPILYISLLTLLFLQACVKVEFFEPGAITLVTEWNKRSEGISIPEDYTVEIDNHKLDYKTTTNNLSRIEPGKYQLYIYNTADKIVKTDNIVTAETANGIVSPNIGWFFSLSQQVQIKKINKTQYIVAEMVQQVRQLNFVLTVTNGSYQNISSITAELDGVAYQLDISTGEVTGNAVKVIPVFTRNGDKVSATINLLGIIPTQQQNLTLNITFNDGTTQQIVSDISAQLATFNQNKHLPMTLSNSIEINAQVGATASINDWLVNTESIIVNV